MHCSIFRLCGNLKGYVILVLELRFLNDAPELGGSPREASWAIRGGPWGRDSSCRPQTCGNRWPGWWESGSTCRKLASAPTPANTSPGASPWSRVRVRLSMPPNRLAARVVCPRIVQTRHWCLPQLAPTSGNWAPRSPDSYCDSWLQQLGLDLISTTDDWFSCKLTSNDVNPACEDRSIKFPWRHVPLPITLAPKFCVASWHEWL